MTAEPRCSVVSLAYRRPKQWSVVTMTNVRSAFDEFLQHLELTEVEQDTASRQQNDLRARIRDELGGVDRDVLVGSYARGTAIRPLNDIDVFLVLDPSVHSARHHKEPTHILDRLRTALQACYPPPGPRIRIRIQGRSVNIEFSRTEIGYDIIPAFSLTPDGTNVEGMIYEIPDRDRQSWIKTNPERHRQECVSANARAGGMLNRLIKAAKYWNSAQCDANGDKPVRSFHLEVMAYEAFATKPTDERRGLWSLFGFLATRITSRCSDPARLGPNVDAGMTPDERQRIQLKLQKAERIASEAVRQEHLGNHVAACNNWRSLFGPKFPLS
ncbi:MAG TPA: CBASS oligonucleotide cyclase [Kofleriaceae bacterium]|nr:CBASS oligonucleotide cyclase [Kofleriaceae bacterium]